EAGALSHHNRPSAIRLLEVAERSIRAVEEPLERGAFEWIFISILIVVVLQRNFRARFRLDPDGNHRCLHPFDERCKTRKGVLCGLRSNRMSRGLFSNGTRRNRLERCGSQGCRQRERDGGNINRAAASCICKYWSSPSGALLKIWLLINRGIGHAHLQRQIIT